MDRITGFNPIETHDSKILILGSMPSVQSLTEYQYYAHPRNAFWRIMALIVGFSPTISYETRVQALKNAKIAVWDVIASCTRLGSLDSNIDVKSIQTNDFKYFFKSHSHIQLVCFNGSAAEQNYQKFVLPHLGHHSIQYIRLPSTSPAHASLSMEKKCEIWSSHILLP